MSSDYPQATYQPSMGPGGGMPEPPPVTASDLEHLRLLSIFHYVFGGLSLLTSFIPLIYVAIGVVMMNGGMSQGGNGPPPELGGFFVCIGVFAMLIGVTISSLFLLVGKRLSQRRSHTFCLIIAGLECTSVPIGTTLGVFTFIVLLRPAVKNLFQETSARY